jgi:hypothetical protein
MSPLPAAAGFPHRKGGQGQAGINELRPFPQLHPTAWIIGLYIEHHNGRHAFCQRFVSYPSLGTAANRKSAEYHFHEMSQRVYTSEELDRILSPDLPAPGTLWVESDSSPESAMGILEDLECTVQVGRSAVYELAKRCCSPSLKYTLGDVQIVAYFFSNYSRTFSLEECAYVLIHLAKRILTFFSDAINDGKPPLGSQWAFWKYLLEETPRHWPRTAEEAAVLAARFGGELDKALTDRGMPGVPLKDLKEFAQFQMLERAERERGGIVDAAMGYPALRQANALWTDILEQQSKARAKDTVDQCIRVRLRLQCDS